MLFSSCKRALQYGCFQCRRGRAVSAIIGLSKNYSCKENDGIWAFGRCTTRLSAVSAGCHAMLCEDGGTHAKDSSCVVDSDKGAPNEQACPITREDGGQGSTKEKYSQAQVLRSRNDTNIVGLQEMRLEKMPVVSCDRALCPAEMCASCPHGQQGKGDDGESTFECDRTFCPPERGEHCPLAQQGLPQPRGDQSLAHQLDDGLHNLNRTLKQPRAYHALLVDAAGTLIHASQSTEEIYHQIGVKYGVHYSQDEIAAKYKAAYGQPWCRYRMRYEDDGRLFWQCIVQEATGCKDPGLLEDLYHYYTTEKAWHIGDPDAEKALKAIRRAGIKIAVVSNFDTRLRPLMRVLECYDWFDTIVVSAEVGVEKPNPEIFMIACKELGVKPEQVLHVGDDKTNDIVGASAAGCDSLLWGLDVASFAEVAKKLGVKV